jgi:hypothetical protein
MLSEDSHASSNPIPFDDTIDEFSGGEMFRTAKQATPSTNYHSNSFMG